MMLRIMLKLKHKNRKNNGPIAFRMSHFAFDQAHRTSHFTVRILSGAEHRTMFIFVTVFILSV